jgi:hypothetical protein
MADITEGSLERHISRTYDVETRSERVKFHPREMAKEMGMDLEDFKRRLNSHQSQLIESFRAIIPMENFQKITPIKAVDEHYTNKGYNLQLTKDMRPRSSIAYLVTSLYTHDREPPKLINTILLDEEVNGKLQVVFHVSEMSE